MDELPTESTAIMMTTFMTDGRPTMPAFWMAMTNGEAAASASEWPVSRRGSV
jgi:hypothetical protein